jgi:3'-phosphoadenosine 5'-phosphosulfate sulfotransferase (PAPS reductase)/FAD synthetase
MLHIVSFSSGLSSALAVERVLARYGPEPVRVVFMDTLIEDDDNYRFLDEMEARWLDVYELSEVERIAEGRTPYEVHDNYVPSQKRARCTYMLKIQA